MPETTERLVFEIDGTRYVVLKEPLGAPAQLFMRRRPREMESPYHVVGYISDREADGGKWTKYGSLCGLLKGRLTDLRVQGRPFETKFCGHCRKLALSYQMLREVA
jgi:hypothetical protein